MMMALAQVIPKNSPPLDAAMPISSPYLLTALTTLTMMAVEIAEAMPRAINANWKYLLAYCLRFARSRYLQYPTRSS